MIKVIFVCLGNICRSPMAEFIFKDMISKMGLSNEFYIKSAATSYEEIGNDMHYGAKEKLIQKNIPFTKRKATRITPDDYKKYDYIIGMEESNIRNIKKIVGSDTDNKIYKLLDFSKRDRDIADPWYTGDFETTYNDIVEGCNGFIEPELKHKKDPRRIRSFVNAVKTYNKSSINKSLSDDTEELEI